MAIVLFDGKYKYYVLAKYLTHSKEKTIFMMLLSTLHFYLRWMSIDNLVSNK